MINCYAYTRRKKDFLYSYIEEELKKNHIELSLFDDSLQWNIYSTYGEGFMKTGPNTEDGYSYHKGFDLDFVVLECITTPNFFRDNKIYWFIFRLGETSGVDFPQIQEYKSQIMWDSDSITKAEIVEIVNVLCQEANNFYYRREQEYREERFREQEFEDFGPIDNRTDEEKYFDSLMDDNDAWSNLY